jgi:hypothetical protein
MLDDSSSEKDPGRRGVQRFHSAVQSPFGCTGMCSDNFPTVIKLLKVHRGIAHQPFAWSWGTRSTTK